MRVDDDSDDDRGIVLDDDEQDADPGRVFVYGTLMDQRIRKQALGHDVAVEPGVLPDYRRELVDHPVHAFNLVPQRGVDTVGEVFDSNPSDLARLDRWESDYERTRCTLEDGGDAWVYIEPQQ
jgi:gamma-glutamylcyclotransferase (GGCT)/AIG2-like uncharacterized protein YtfP